MDDEARIWDLLDLETPWCLRVVATLGIPDHLAAGVSSVDALAEAAGCDAAALDRVLGHLAGRGVLTRTADGGYALAGPGRALLDPGMRIGLDLDGIGGRMAGAWASLLTTVRTGSVAYADVFGLPFWADLDAHPGVARSFDALMGPGHGTPDPEILVDGDWTGVTSVVDVGGGTGAMLAEILRVHPSVRGTLVDLPRTVARSTETFRAAGVTDRVTVVGQSFFGPLPPRGDVYLLKNLLADWPDAEATALLRRCAEAARPHGRVVVLGGVKPEAAYGGGDLLMMVLLGGRERTVSDFAVLASAAGLRVTATGVLPGGKYAVEARPLPDET